jgi:DNA-binding IclR family transcriptional regulator
MSGAIASNETTRVISYVGSEHPIPATTDGKAHLSTLEHDIELAMMGDAPQTLYPKYYYRP